MHRGKGELKNTTPPINMGKTRAGSWCYKCLMLRLCGVGLLCIPKLEAYSTFFTKLHQGTIGMGPLFCPAAGSQSQCTSLNPKFPP